METVQKVKTALEVDGCTAVDAVEMALKLLEDDEMTNAGRGSNLSWDATVRCDASIMDGHSLNWSAMGAMKGIRNPISAARKLLDKHNEANDNKPELVRPLLLVGDSATKWALDRGCESAQDLTTS